LDERAFPFVRINRREAKPRQRGLTEIRGPYYSVMGARYLADLLETMGEYVDGVKYAGGSFALMPRKRVQELNDLAHKYNAYVSTGGWVEHVLAHGSADDVSRYIGEARALGFDLIELSTGFISLPPNDLVALIGAVKSAGLKAKPELGIQFGAGGATKPPSLRSRGRATCAGSSPRRAVVWKPEPTAS
jgi:phosphosulfolactate synthase (CoM biosynthesis protein A)